MSHSAYSLPASAYEALGLSEEVVRIATTPRPKPPTIAAPNLLQDRDALAPEQPLAMNESSITLYAELLLHIRTVTLFASLRSVHTRETKARLESEGCAITVTHEGASATLRLPIQVEGGGDASLSLPALPPSKELTLRLQIEEREGSNMLGALRSEERKANVVPWGGVALSAAEEVTIYCATCHAVVVPKDTIREWRDLPNENWAEMMDFWHCHKPDEHHLHDHAQEEAIGQKAYAAGNRLQATKGVGFVDLGSFLLEAGDCSGIEVRTVFSSTRCLHTRHHVHQLHMSGQKRTWPQPFPWRCRGYKCPRATSSVFHLARRRILVSRRWACWCRGGAAYPSRSHVTQRPLGMAGYGRATYLPEADITMSMLLPSTHVSIRTSSVLTSVT